jgi:hypothetical protein
MTCKTCFLSITYHAVVMLEQRKITYNSLSIIRLRYSRDMCSHGSSHLKPFYKCQGRSLVTGIRTIQYKFESGVDS